MKNTEKQTRQQTPQGVLNIIYRNQLLKSKRTEKRLEELRKDIIEKIKGVD